MFPSRIFQPSVKSFSQQRLYPLILLTLHKKKINLDATVTYHMALAFRFKQKKVKIMVKADSHIFFSNMEAIYVCVYIFRI